MALRRVAPGPETQPKLLAELKTREAVTNQAFDALQSELKSLEP